MKTIIWIALILFCYAATLQVTTGALFAILVICGLIVAAGGVFLLFVMRQAAIVGAEIDQEYEEERAP